MRESGSAGAWHVAEALAARYAAGMAPEPDAWALEKHIEACGACAVRVSAAVRGTAAGAVLADVRGSLLAAVTSPPPDTGGAPDSGPGFGRGRGFGRAPAVGFGARVLWAAGPALRGSWLVALVLVAAGAVGLAYATGFAGARPLLLALAPVLPPAGVAVSYGRHADPMHEIGAATPGGGLRLLLTRTSVVLAVSLPPLTLVGALLPTAAPGTPVAAAWLLPGLALTLAALALGSYTGYRSAACAVGAAWALALAVPLLRTARAGAAAPELVELSAQLARLLSGTATQGLWAAGAAVCAAVLVARRHSFDRPAPGGW
ncbi:zf-HC2 domain-containing protein [Streptomyces sp. NPDC088124]|uniref:zf-HC2 domain-containing protein n=1 Tax=Streptomyces sp. NPDC088124 TaxID=3154654 RepID=UPI0034381689